MLKWHNLIFRHIITDQQQNNENAFVCRLNQIIIAQYVNVYSYYIHYNYSHSRPEMSNYLQQQLHDIFFLNGLRHCTHLKIK